MCLYVNCCLLIGRDMEKTNKSIERMIVVGALVVLAILVTGCFQGGRVSEGTLIGPEGGAVVGPNGVTITFPPGALDNTVGVTLRKVTREEAETLDIQGLCGDAYIVTPLSLTLYSPVTVSLPDENCENAAFLVRPQRHSRWSAFPSTVQGDLRVTYTPHLGVFGVGSLDFQPRGDTMVFVGSGFEPRVMDRLGREINEAWIELRSSDTTRIAPDRERGSMIQHTLRRGLAVLEVSVPAAGVREFVNVTVIANPAARLTIVRGREQRGTPGSVLQEPVVAEVLDENGEPVEGVWVDFYMKGRDEGPRFIGGGPTDANGRKAVRWRLPYESGEHILHVVVPGTHLAERAIANARE